MGLLEKILCSGVIEGNIVRVTVVGLLGWGVIEGGNIIVVGVIIFLPKCL